MNFVVYKNGVRVSGYLGVEDWAPEEVGVFESLRTYGAKIFRKEEHLARFMESAKTAGVWGKFTVRDLDETLEKALRAFHKENSKAAGRDLFLRITFICGEILVMAGERRHSAELYQKGVALRTSPVRRSAPAAFPSAVKTTAYQNSLLAMLEPKSSEIYEWIFLDSVGYVTEVGIGNLFIVKENRLFTPSGEAILHGVTRRFVIECAHLLKIPVKETRLTRHDIYNADEVFLTNTSWEILPVRELDGRQIKGKIPGILTCKLHQAFKKKAKKECL